MCVSHIVSPTLFVFRIFIFMPGLSLLTANCLCAVAQTCKHLRSLASADDLWQPLSRKMWNRLQPSSPQSFKQVQPLTAYLPSVRFIRVLRCTASRGENGASRWIGCSGRVQWATLRLLAVKCTRGKPSQPCQFWQYFAKCLHLPSSKP